VDGAQRSLPAARLTRPSASRSARAASAAVRRGVRPLPGVTRPPPPPRRSAGRSLGVPRGPSSWALLRPDGDRRPERYQRTRGDRVLPGSPPPGRRDGDLRCRRHALASGAARRRTWRGRPDGRKREPAHAAPGVRRGHGRPPPAATGEAAGGGLAERAPRVPGSARAAGGGRPAGPPPATRRPCSAAANPPPPDSEMALGRLAVVDQPLTTRNLARNVGEGP
jgi:hypothetical protein